jgi:hypothetical protein
MGDGPGILPQMAFARYADAPLYYETSVCTAVLAGEEKDLDIIMVHVVTQPVWSADGRGVGMTGLAWVTIDTMLPCDIMIAGTQELASLIRPGDSLVLLDVKLAGEHVDRTKINSITASIHAGPKHDDPVTVYTGRRPVKTENDLVNLVFRDTAASLVAANIGEVLAIVVELALSVYGPTHHHGPTNLSID